MRMKMKTLSAGDNDNGGQEEDGGGDDDENVRFTD